MNQLGWELVARSGNQGGENSDVSEAQEGGSTTGSNLPIPLIKYMALEQLWRGVWHSSSGL